jgi:hypothetical protein
MLARPFSANLLQLKLHVKQDIIALQGQTLPRRIRAQQEPSAPLARLQHYRVRWEQPLKECIVLQSLVRLLHPVLSAPPAQVGLREQPHVPPLRKDPIVLAELHVLLHALQQVLLLGATALVGQSSRNVAPQAPIA